MNTVCIHGFSGTGNTLLVTRHLAQALAGHGVAVSCRPLLPGLPVEAAVGDLGLTFPVACQSTYPFVWDFVDALPPGNGRGVFVVDTLHMTSGGLLAPLRRRFEEKGYHPLGAIEVRMPSNLRLQAISPEGAKRVLDQALAKVDAFAAELAAGTARWPRAGWFESTVYALSRWRGTWAFARWGMGMRLDRAQCSGCGLCEKLCPVGAIRYDREPALDRRACQLCMRCHSFCPVGAIRSRLSWNRYHAVTAAELLAANKSEGEES